MKMRYLVEITDPKTHMVKVKMSFKPNGQEMNIFMPSWSPGSYLMREYSKNISVIKATNEKGEYLNFVQIEKGIFKLNLGDKKVSKVDIDYSVYCHELTVRTSHIDESHAFLHGPSYLMGVVGESLIGAEIEFRFPPLWSKITTPLKSISEKREEFTYTAANYDVLIDAPTEIGCHETDGFMFEGKEHHLAYYGKTYPHNNNLKEDIEQIVKTVASHFSSIPYDHYYIITHFAKGLFGGLEHLDSTALQFDGRKLSSRKDYVNWLALVAHEYFHTWNVKRIRPIELGPFDYTKENYTRMHWLTEGLTSFMDELLVLRSGLCTTEEYLDMQTKNLSRYLSIPGKKFHSLEESSFNAWIKLYRPDENSLNSSISYYLKGGLVFSTLHFDFKKIGRNINDLLTALWDRYLQNPEAGMTSDEVLLMIEKIGNKDIRNRFELRISTTEDIDFETYYKHIGCEFIWNETDRFSLGVDFINIGERAFIDKVHLDGAAFKAGLNAGDEIVAINDIRFLKEDIIIMNENFLLNRNYTFKVSRLNNLMDINVMTEKGPRQLAMIKVVDNDLFEACFKK